jgi:hypothetical protein
MIKSFLFWTLLVIFFFQQGFGQNMTKDSNDLSTIQIENLNTDGISKPLNENPQLLKTDYLPVPSIDSSLIKNANDTSVLQKEPPFEPWIQISLNIALSAYSSDDIGIIETATDTIFENWKDEIQEDSSSSPNQQGFPGAHIVLPIGASLRLHYNSLSLILGREAWQAGQNNIFSTYENTKEVSWSQWATQYRIGLNWDIPYSFIHFKDSSSITIGAHFLLVDQSVLSFENQSSKMLSGRGYELQMSSRVFRGKNISARIELFWNSIQLSANDKNPQNLFPNSNENLSWNNNLFGGRFQFLIGI